VLRFWYEYSKPKPGWKWTPAYPLPFPTTKGTRTAYVAIEDVESNECPVSRLTRDPSDESRDLVQIFSQVNPIEQLHPMGEAKRWPAAFLDAYLVLSREKQRHDNAQQIAVNKASS
jgi:hypothetical protein